MAAGGRSVEVEWQFEVADVDALARWLGRVRFDGGWSVVPTGTRRQRDVYLDTGDWRLHAAGYALRIRRSGKSVEATLKGLVRGHRGLARRPEISERLGGARIATVLAARGRVGVLVRRLVADGRLRRLFAIGTRRGTYALHRRGRAVGEIALDRSVISASSGRCRRLQRVEVEVTAGRAAAIAPFVASLRRARHLKVARRSKFEEGLAAAALAVPRRH